VDAQPVSSAKKERIAPSFKFMSLTE
jgi:hypothetical protein